MSNGMQQLRERRFFENWDGHVAPERVQTSEAILRRLIDDLLALGSAPTEPAVREAVTACVRRFNEIDDGWICTIEREDIYEQVGQIIDICGFEFDEDWVDERDW